MIKIKLNTKKSLADINTPVSIYLRLRDKFSNCLLLESSDYHGSQNSYSFICCEPLATFQLNDSVISVELPGEFKEEKELTKNALPLELKGFLDKFVYIGSGIDTNIPKGLFGYTSYDTIEKVEDLKLNNQKGADANIPTLRYSLYKFIIVINHFSDEMIICHNELPDYSNIGNEIEKIENLLRNRDFPVYKFNKSGEESSNFEDYEFLSALNVLKEHNHRGDVFQIVLSRKFKREFKGDEFNVYRALRSVNPSPYLFYFDYGSYKLLGSSPEAQIVIKDGVASIHPIAGTFKRTGNDEADKELAEKLKLDPKENSEHVMLVDLARNDLSTCCSEVAVEVYKEVQFYSHVIHLVSKVSGKLDDPSRFLEVVMKTFPAGTLSGAPKYKAMELIDKYEKGRRGFYGGCIGFIGFNGDFNHAIMIRSFLSKDNHLYYQAGAGVVSESIPQNELNEVNNKLLALKRAIDLAEEIN